MTHTTPAVSAVHLENMRVDLKAADSEEALLAVIKKRLPYLLDKDRQQAQYACAQRLRELREAA